MITPQNFSRRLFAGGLMILVSWAQAQDQQKRAPERIIFKEAKVDNTKAALRDLQVGCVFVTSEPLQAKIRGVQDDRLVFTEITPILLCDRAVKAYQIVFTQEGYKERRVSVKPKPGRVDTLGAILEPIISQKRGSGKGWRWLWSGITAAGVVAVAALIFKPDDEKNENPTADLPNPPDRPAPRF